MFGVEGNRFVNCSFVTICVLCGWREEYLDMCWSWLVQLVG